MPRQTAVEPGKCLPIATPRSFELSTMQTTCVRHLVGHSLTTIERELILETLRYHRGNRTHAARVLRISVRCLRDKIRIYQKAGERVPEPGSPCSDHAVQPFARYSHLM